ncbi:SH3 and multiple ankyrin repeat domains protein [Paragonimus heterotremus]|uniref:SH3 and multiple ankyrin repeat domains protein n=1 Tax=Paragonimus heterotremus TaxID=100268 RepID=A0A8J4SV59_9TREM|nr:SH3 and multiple ankyrin repeat domains protein [Paragonimus heterotremus]
MCDSDSGLSLSMNGSQTDAPCQSFIFIRVTSSELNLERTFNFNATDLIFDIKLNVLNTISQPVKDKWNFGLFLPPSKGKAGKFLQEDRMLREYPFDNSVGHLELKYKQRVYRVLRTNVNKLKKLHIKSNLRQFLDSVKSGNVDRVSKWLNKGIDPNFHWKENGETPLTLAAKLEKPKEMIMTLVAGGAHLDYRAEDTMTPLHRAAATGNYEAIKVLLDLGQSPNTRDQYDLTPLYYAVINDTIALCAERLLYDHSVLGTTDEAGLQEIHQACRFGRVQHLETLIAYGADINSQTSKNGNTPLHICAFTGQEACARLLLFRGAERTLVNRAGHTAYQQAILSEHSSVAELIKNFQNKDVVPIRGVPKRNERRRSFSRARLQQRCASLGRLADYSSGSTTASENSSTRPGSPADTDDNDSVTNAETLKAKFKANRFTTSVSGYCLDSMLTSPSDGVNQHEKTNARTNSQFENYEMNQQALNGHMYQPTSPTRSYSNYAVSMATSGSCQSVHQAGQAYPSTNQRKSNSRPCLDPMWLMTSNNENNSDTASIFSTVSSLRGGQPPSSLGSTASALQMVLNNQASILDLDTSNLPRMIVLQKGPRGFGFVVRGRRGVPGEFQPTLEVPALQYLEKIDAGSAADRASLKPGDYILEVNGTNVTTMSHEAVVQLIRSSGDILGMKVITVGSSQGLRSSIPFDAEAQTSGHSNLRAINTGSCRNLGGANDASSLYSISTTDSVRSQMTIKSPYVPQKDPYSTISRASFMPRPTNVTVDITASKDRVAFRQSPFNGPPKPRAPPPPVSVEVSSPAHIHRPPLLSVSGSHKPNPSNGYAFRSGEQPQSLTSQMTLTSGTKSNDKFGSKTSYMPSTDNISSPPPQIPSPQSPSRSIPHPPPPPILPSLSGAPLAKVSPKVKFSTSILNNGDPSHSLNSGPDTQETDEQLPLPPPPQLDSPGKTTNASELMLSMLRRVNTNGENSPGQPAQKDPRASFDDHLRQAVERRRQKLEMYSSEEDDETRSKIDLNVFQHNSSSTSTLYSNTNNVMPKSPKQNDQSSFGSSTLHRTLSVSQTGEKSFKAAAEKFHAKALARTMAQSTTTIPPPDNFKDARENMTHQSNVHKNGITSTVQKLALEFNAQSSKGAAETKTSKPGGYSPACSSSTTKPGFVAHSNNDSKVVLKRTLDEASERSTKDPQSSTPSFKTAFIPPPPPILIKPTVQYKTDL